MPVSVGPDVLRDQLKQQIEQYDSDPAQVRNTVRILLKNHPGGFCEAAAPFLTGQTPAAHFLVELLSGQGLLPLCNPALLSLEEEVAVARAVMEGDPLLDVKLARRISALTHGNRGQTEIAAAQRILEILAAISDGTRILPILIQVLRDPDGRIRSKAALLVGRTNKSAQWVEQVMREPDARVRANSIEALWGVDNEAVRSVLRAATKDPNNRVLGNALLGLYRLGDVSVIGRVLALAAHSAPLFRSTAAWVMGETDDPRFLAVLARMIRETDAQARSSVFRAIARLKQAAARYTDAPLLRVRLCQFRGQPDGTRLVRAAVALPEGGEVPGLLPTHVVLWEDQHIVSDYTVRRTRAADSLVLCVAMPAARTCPYPNGDVLEQAIRDSIGSKGPTGRWSILRFGAPRDEDTPPIDTNVVPPCILTPDAGTLRAALDNPENRYGYAEAVRAFLNTLAQSNGNRNLLLIEDRSDGSTLPEIPAARWTSIVTEAQAASIAIHAVVLTSSGRPPEMLASACGQTDGICLSTSSLDQVSALCERLYMGLEHPYEVVYRPGVPEAASFKLEVYCPQGHGEDTAPAP